MILLQEPALSHDIECPYIHGRQSRFEYFFAHDLSADELEVLLSSGWRKFGYYFFRPQCAGCTACIPIRIKTGEFTPSKDQQRNLKRNADIELRVVPLKYRDEIYDIYCEHTRFRFDKEPDSIEYFVQTFYSRSCPSMQSEFYLDGECVAVGFVDLSEKGLSSVYFIYRESVEKRGIGIFGMLKEIEYAKNIGLDFYYSGYYIEENARMNYKGRFYPAETMNWENGAWSERKRNNG
jgi:leucyl-tRNA---protein transferase